MAAPAVVYADAAGQHHVRIQGNAELLAQHLPDLLGLDSPFVSLQDTDAQGQRFTVGLSGKRFDDVMLHVDEAHLAGVLRRYLFVHDVGGIVEGLQRLLKGVVAVSGLYGAGQAIHGVIGHRHELRRSGVDVFAAQDDKAVRRLSVHLLDDVFYRQALAQLHVQILFVGRYADAESRSEAQLHVGIKAFGIGNGQAGPDDDVADGPGKIQVGQKLQSPVLFNS